jgi:hypothetical protein
MLFCFANIYSIIRLKINFFTMKEDFMKRVLTIIFTIFIMLFVSGCSSDEYTDEYTDGIEVSIETYQENLVYVVTGYAGDDLDVIIPSNINGKQVIGVGAKAFAGLNLNNVTIPEGITTIRDSAFSNNSLTSVTFPSSLTTIGDSAFSNNTLTSVTFPSSLTTIGDSAFSNNSLTSVTISDSVTTIGDSAFSNNSLTSVTISDSVTTIEDYAFSENQLTSVTIIGDENRFNDIWLRIGFPNYLNPIYTVIDDYVFFPPTGTIIYYIGTGSDIIIPSQIDGFDVIRISSWAFSGIQLTSVTIPEEVIIIEPFAFWWQVDITSITILGDESRFNYMWEDIGFPTYLKP